MPEPLLRLQADLSFTSTLSDGSAGLSGSVRADGRTINVVVSEPVGTITPSRGSARRLARSLAQRRLRLLVHGQHGLIVGIGDVRAPWWQRFLTGSTYVRLGRLRDVRALIARSAPAGRAGPAVPPAAVPSTPFPMFPTLSTRGRRPVTTTHDPRGGGMPRLVFALSPWPRAGEVQRVAYLKAPRTTIGSAADCDVRIEGLQPLHAVIDVTPEDEYVLTHVGPAGSSTVAGMPARRSLLRTGAGVALDDTRLTYSREEYADHGRPYGGRIGGELGLQRPQAAPRPRRRGVVGKPRSNQDPGGRYFH